MIINFVGIIKRKWRIQKLVSGYGSDNRLISLEYVSRYNVW